MKARSKLGFKEELAKDKVIKNARKITGLHDLGRDFWDEPLDRLISSINEEAILHPLGRFITGKRLENLLASRLRAEYWFKKYPEILDQELYPVILIAGLQRTGTTKLLRLLGTDPENRTLASWEALNPAPYLNQNSRRQDQRIKFAKTAEKALKFMAPSFFAIHPVEYLAEEEDILLLDTTFMSTTPEATMHVPSYSSWLEKTDQTLAYNYEVKLLKLLQWQRPGSRWILKSPHHLEFLDLATRAFKEVRFIWTHRNISQSIPSFLNMLNHAYSIFSDAIPPDTITTHWLKKIKYMLNKAITFRSNMNTFHLFTDIFYDELINEPMNQLDKIYSPIKDIDDKLRAKFKESEKDNYREKYGQHRYDISDFNLSEVQINTQFDFYLSYLRSLKKREHL